MADLKGRRRPDTVYGQHMPDMRAGDYWKIMNEDGTPRQSSNPGNLTGTCWHVLVPWPDGEGYGYGWLENHTVREHEDGTISVRPNDGSSNSILVGGGAGGHSWHGYIDHGVFQEC